MGPVHKFACIVCLIVIAMGSTSFAEEGASTGSDAVKRLMNEYPLLRRGGDEQRINYYGQPMTSADDPAVAAAAWLEAYDAALGVDRADLRLVREVAMFLRGTDSSGSVRRTGTRPDM